jgi:hypothetical protein
MQSSANMGRGMITRPIWKFPCIKLFITYFRYLEKRHPYWPGPIWASIWKWSCSNPINGYFPVVWKYGVYFRVYWSYKHAFIWTKYAINILVASSEILWKFEIFEILKSYESFEILWKFRIFQKFYEIFEIFEIFWSFCC